MHIFVTSQEVPFKLWNLLTSAVKYMSHHCIHHPDDSPSKKLPLILTFGDGSRERMNVY